MPRITTDLTDRMAAGLQAETDRYNAAHDTTLTLKQWLRLHLQEIVIAPQLQAVAAALTEQHQRDANAQLAAAIRAARDELIASLA